MKKDFDGQGWASSNKDQFDALIANARRKRGTPVEKNEKDEARDGTMKMLPKSVESIELNPGLNQQADVPQPYEGNEDALSIIREKMDQANRDGFASQSLNQASEPTSQRNEDSAITDGESLPDAPEEDGIPVSFESPTQSQTSQGPPSLSKYPFSSPTRLPDAPEEDGIPVSFESPTRSQTSQGPPSLLKYPFSSPTRKLPMFQMPEDPVVDMDSGTTVQ